MIKVLQVLECGGPGGTGEQVAAICNGLDPARFETGLVFAARGTDPDAYRRKCAGAKKSFHVEAMTREISPSLDAEAFGFLKALFEAERPDVVHAHSSKAGVLARAAAKFAGVPRVFYTPHGYGFLQQDRSAAQRFLYRAVERVASTVGEIVACSPSEAAHARRLSCGRPVHVVPDAYLGEFGEPAPHDGLVLGSCGRMTYARNPDAWVLLAQRLTDSRNGVKLRWIGGGEDEPRVKTQLENMNLLGKVGVTGWLTADQAREKLRELDAFVHFSRWDAMPNAVLEAMACGLPVVASDVDGNRDAIVDGETGFLVRSERELLERCQLLVDDPGLRRRLGSAGRERVRRRFSRESFLSALSGLYSGRA